MRKPRSQPAFPDTAIETPPHPLWTEYGRGLLLSAGVHAALVYLLIGWTSQPPQPPPPDVRRNVIEITLTDAERLAPDPAPDVSADAPGETRVEAGERPLPTAHAPPSPQQETAATPAVRAPSPATLPAAPIERAAPSPASTSPLPTPDQAEARAPDAGNAESAWERLVLTQLEQRKRYPARAQRTGRQDTVYVRIVVDRSGRVLSSAVHRSRQIAMLDAAALDLVRRSSPLPPPPAEVEGARIEFVVPIEYLIRSNS